ncbi:heterokaryon incompatibility protein-domain-containing protein [Xylariaceae sp. AK1471]|nr:heterokaryon incompatibility protein-domain-containing protein [Xylariaceae sp. AK1471]
MGQVKEEAVTAVIPPCAVCSRSFLLVNRNQRYSMMTLSDQSELVCDRCAFVRDLVKTCLENGIIAPRCRSSDPPSIQWEYEHQIPSTPRWTNIIWDYGHNTTLWGRSFEVFTLPGHPKPFPDIPEKELHGDTSSAESLARAQEWLKTCQESHTCLQSTAIPALPARVLDVRTSPVRLYETHGDRGKYICLSHCWGATRPTCITTTETLETNLLGIPLATLPATFRDAIHYTIRLGFDFLWIDSICIIQDDETDWVEQSAQMADIYENAHLTLCATASADDDGGLHGQAPQNVRPQKVIVNGRDGIEYTIFVRTELGDRHLPLPASLGGFSWQDSRDVYFPLLTRAWVLQERLLSRRLLHFAWGELLWECSELMACGCFPGIGLHQYQPSLAHEAIDKRLFKKYLTSPNTYHNVADHWHKVVEAFTGLDISHTRDKLPALSGIACRTLQQLRPGDQYLAGLWRSTLLSDMCWSASGNSEPRRGRSPTWSWASIDGPVRFTVVKAANTIISVVDASVSAASSDPTGEVTSGYIVLNVAYCSGRLKIKPYDHQDGKVFWAGSGPDSEFYLDSPNLLRDGILADGDIITCIVLGFYKEDFPFCLVLKRCYGTLGTDDIPIYERVGSMGRPSSFMGINRFRRRLVKIV